ncbi:beta-propeller domain-containing protein [Aurantiacibacter sp. MUD61]|uniref:beta-propeller domain-containing protein n=1 Tax=Aurantiacibacter sp. MUD61 TaxID=3009083 RepID=UPI0022F0CD18|nr:beta-propeller domain-containing protein [Aurantiacibacter sp. MUD61]
MLNNFRFGAALLIGTLALGGCRAADELSVPDGDGAGLEAFESEDAFERFAERMEDLQGSQQTEYVTTVDIQEEAAAEAAPPPPPMASVSADAVARVDGEQITNTQEQGVDEGAIVKDAGDYLVILRRGRIFTVRHGGNMLDPVDSSDAFPPGEFVPGTWYDEMLVRGNQIIVVGYSYGDFGTEINRFTLGDDGSISYRDTHYLRSGDYYSSSNYASRMIGDELIFYAPVYMNWADWRSTMPALRRGGASGEVLDLVEPESIYATPDTLRGKYPVGVAHTVTRCDLSAAELECEAEAVLGGWGRVFYVSPRAVYLWTEEPYMPDAEERDPAQLYRLPLDGSRPGAVPVEGAPVDQFSFSEDRTDDVLRVIVRGDANRGGEGMWGAEFSSGDVGLLTIPLGSFTDGSERIPQEAMRELPSVVGYRFHNRFVPGYLLYTAANYGSESDGRFFYAVPLDGREAQRIDLQHGVTRFDIMGSDAVAIGPASGGALGFSAVSLGEDVTIEDVYLLPSASEGEQRSQAFFYRPDSDSRGGLSGTLGLPVTRTSTGSGGEFLGNASAIFFLRREDREFSPAGDLVSRAKAGVDDNCVASCVDWYGNARPIFLRDRIFALMGYELVEGRIENGTIREVRRANFTPRGRGER